MRGKKKGGQMRGRGRKAKIFSFRTSGYYFVSHVNIGNLADLEKELERKSNERQ